MFLLLLLLPFSSSFLFGNQQCCNYQPVYSQPQYPQYQPQYPAYQTQYQPQSYYPPPPPQQGYVVAPSTVSRHYGPEAPVYRNTQPQYEIPTSAYHNTYPPGAQPPLSRSGYSNNFVGEGSISLRPSEVGEKASYVYNRHGANSLRVVEENPTILTLAPESSVIQPTVDEVSVEINAQSRESVHSISSSQPVHRVEKVYRPSPPVHYEEHTITHTIEPASPSPVYEVPAVEEPRNVVESISQFTGEPATTSYPVEQQGYDSAPIVEVPPESPVYEVKTVAPINEGIQASGYKSVAAKRFSGFNDDKLVSGMVRV